MKEEGGECIPIKNDTELFGLNWEIINIFPPLLVSWGGGWPKVVGCVNRGGGGGCIETSKNECHHL